MVTLTTQLANIRYKMCDWIWKSNQTVTFQEIATNLKPLWFPCSITLLDFVSILKLQVTCMHIMGWEEWMEVGWRVTLLLEHSQPNYMCSVDQIDWLLACTGRNLLNNITQ